MHYCRCSPTCNVRIPDTSRLAPGHGTHPAKCHDCGTDVIVGKNESIIQTVNIRDDDSNPIWTFFCVGCSKKRAERSAVKPHAPTPFDLWWAENEPEETYFDDWKHDDLKAFAHHAYSAGFQYHCELV